MFYSSQFLDLITFVVISSLNPQLLSMQGNEACIYDWNGTQCCDHQAQVDCWQTKYAKLDENNITSQYKFSCKAGANDTCPMDIGFIIIFGTFGSFLLIGFFRHCVA